MDNAVSFVQAYMHINGYFTVTEYPVLEAMKNQDYRMVTDLDLLAFRFPQAHQALAGTKQSRVGYSSDPVLQCPADVPDMIIGEVKEGHPEVNKGATNPKVLKAVLARFGCCPVDQADSIIQSFLKHGSVKTPVGHQMRLVAFGSGGEKLKGTNYQIIQLGHVVDYLQRYLRENWSILRHAQFKDPAFSFLMTLEKALQNKPHSGKHHGN